ncbi:hypothetical protein [Martelella mangrovi]|uniref:Transcriptional regulator n=1 Tax=Martelella mangrovi TaxID=1397477 RepID=A0ABV2IFZ6_9HYPH|nr:hypothetical protein [uncultured Martelella sp.]
MTRPALIPAGVWPAVLRDELAAGYVGEKSVDTFLSRVGTIWPQPYIDEGRGKGRFRAWRKSDLDRVIGEQHAAENPQAW